MSGASFRSRLTKRSNSTSIRSGSTEVTPRQKQTAELAAEPRPWQRMPRRRAKTHQVPDREEIGLVVQFLDQLQLVLEKLPHLVGRTPAG